MISESKCGTGAHLVIFVMKYNGLQCQLHIAPVCVGYKRGEISQRQRLCHGLLEREMRVIANNKNKIL